MFLLRGSIVSDITQAAVHFCVDTDPDDSTLQILPGAVLLAQVVVVVVGGSGGGGSGTVVSPFRSLCEIIDFSCLACSLLHRRLLLERGEFCREQRGAVFLVPRHVRVDVDAVVCVCVSVQWPVTGKARAV